MSEFLNLVYDLHNRLPSCLRLKQTAIIYKGIGSDKPNQLVLYWNITDIDKHYCFKHNLFLMTNIFLSLNTEASFMEHTLRRTCFIIIDNKNELSNSSKWSATPHGGRMSYITDKLFLIETTVFQCFGTPRHRDLISHDASVVYLRVTFWNPAINFLLSFT